MYECIQMNESSLMSARCETIIVIKTGASRIWMPGLSRSGGAEGIYGGLGLAGLLVSVSEAVCKRGFPGE